MKKHFNYLPITVVIFLVAPIILLSQERKKSKTIEFAVSGMTCESCELHIETALQELPGVLSSKASYQNETVKVEFDKKRIKSDKISMTIKELGYQINGAVKSSSTLKSGTCCTSNTCSSPVNAMPENENRSIISISDIGEIQQDFNQHEGKIRFVAILSSTCGWCLQGAQSVQAAVVQEMKNKNIEVIIVWTNMLKTDNVSSARKAASFFQDPEIKQFFDSENQFGNLVAKRLNPNGTIAWDFYLFFDADTKLNKELPMPFDYAHQLSNSAHPWTDKSKYFCGPELTDRLKKIVSTL